MEPDKIRAFLKRLEGKRIAVIGDIILDEYLWGSAFRISPEAPVPVVEVKREEHKVGGAGNVALSLKALGCQVSLFGLIGRDSAGSKIESLLRDSNIENFLVKSRDERPTSQKTRVIATRQQVVRIDREWRGELDGENHQEIVSQLKSKNFEAIVLSDYGKGFLSSELCQNIIQLFSEEGRIIVVDPKGRDYEKYRGASLVTPNQDEASLVMGNSVTDSNVAEIASQMRKKFGIKNILVTRSERGMFLLEETGQSVSVPAQAREVFDVTGAGDTVVAFMAASLTGGLNFSDAVHLANRAAGIAVGHVGVYSVLPQDLIQ